MIEDLFKLEREKKKHNYALELFTSKFSKEVIIEAIRRKQIARLTNKDYKNRYSWLTIYDEEINFILNINQEEIDCLDLN